MLDVENSDTAVQGQIVDSETEFVLNYIVNHNDTHRLKYTVKHVADDLVLFEKNYYETAWINENTIEIQENTLTPTTHTGYTYESIDTTAVEGERIANDTVITLTYSVNDYKLVINYLDSETLTPVAATYTSNVVFNTNITVNSPVVDKYLLRDAKQAVIAIDNMPAQDLEFTVLYDKDEHGTDPFNPNTPDGVADRFQAKVTYVVKNGTSNIEYTYVTKMTNGEPAENGTGYLVAEQLPVVTPAPNYILGTWDVTPSTTLAITKDITLTHICDIDVIGTDPTNPEKGDDVADKFQVKVNYVVNNGTPSIDYTYVTKMVNGKPAENGVAHLAENQIAVVNPNEGYTLGTWDVTPTTEVEITKETTFTHTCLKDEHGTDPENPNKPDDIPDEYQVKVNFVAVNGTLSHEYAYVTLMKDGQPAADGIGHLTVAQIPAATANDGYQGCNWDRIPSPSVEITEETTFTITFDAIPYIPDIVDPVDPVEPEVIDPVEPEVVDPVEPEPTPEIIVDPETPEAGDAAWALLNLLAAIATAAFSIILLISKSKKDQDEEEDEEETKQVQEDDEEQAKLNRKKTWKVLSVLTSVLAFVLFFLTEDMSLPMAIVDKWTIVMVVILVVNIVEFYFGRRWHDPKDDDEDTQEQQA